MGCRFCALGCPIIDDDKCCFECENQQECIEKDNDCKGMPKEFKECSYYTY